MTMPTISRGQGTDPGRSNRRRALLRTIVLVSSPSSLWLAAAAACAADVSAADAKAARAVIEAQLAALAADDAKRAFRDQAPKRVGMTFEPTRIVTWDHRKLGGVY